MGKGEFCRASQLDEVCSTFHLVSSSREYLFKLPQSLLKFSDCSMNSLPQFQKNKTKTNKLTIFYPSQNSNITVQILIFYTSKCNVFYYFSCFS